MPEKPKKKNDHGMDMTRYTINHIEDSEKPPEERPVPEWLKARSAAGFMGV